MSSYYKSKIESYDWLEYDEVCSTNDVIKQYYQEYKNIIISAKSQTNGRGRRGRTWSGQSGNLYFTYNVHIKDNCLSQLVCIIGLSMAKTIKSLAENLDVKIKWPNDVLVNGKKISGILLEKIEDSNWAVGIGVNILNSPDLENVVYQATSLKENGIILDRIEFLVYYLKQFMADFDNYNKNGFNQVQENWLKLAYNYQQNITIKNDKSVMSGVFSGLDENGYLLLEENNEIKRVVAGDLFNKI